jgi:hypothetical protein|tara:strand:- start:2350 stop:2547 length:198 start_codon:yes stop_codon:yes gene_type:complete
MTKLEEVMQLVRLSALSGKLEREAKEALTLANENITIANLEEAKFKIMELSLIYDEINTLIEKDK